ncbi:antibiotic biosynthesis monooxygenase [Sinomicrobium kalidii]|uniref:putative quinol monooxygenase n=1 Tax=Sinomicrobium kalidii TaxID=2900738 RepID=UPI001E57788C|nr:putative quinol monooxygenase [Sinomicrobium kalidii]UGU15862.1 antibiotic biosynthesis monooxygenase [Sinomicrobium kalidii]
MKKTIIAQLSIQETKTEQFLKLAEIMVNKSIAENGCLAYKLLKEVDKENEFLIYEKYENESAVERHNSSEHFKSFLDSVLPLLTKEPAIEKF